MRVKATALVGLGIWLLYVVIIVALQKPSGVPYPELLESPGNLARGVLPSLVIGGLIIAGLSAWMGWWGVAMRDQFRIRAWWMLIAPALALVAAISNFAFTDWGAVGIPFFLAALAVGIAVGFSEEFVTRGMLLVGLRGSVPEVAVWAITCLLFGLMHTVNIFDGAPVSGTLSQIISSAMAGSTFYILRRYFGSLIPAMIVHGLWDMSVFVQVYSGAPGSILSLLEWPAGIVAVVVGFIVALRTQKGPVEPYARGAAEPVLSPA